MMVVLVRRATSTLVLALIHDNDLVETPATTSE